MEDEFAARLATLGHPSRLAVFRLLMRRYPDHVPAGELARALNLKPSTLSAYLAALGQAGLVNCVRHGTSLRYRVTMAGVQRTLDTLQNECCRGRPELCAPPGRRAHGQRSGAPAVPYKVLFICTGNSARSIFAESILRAEAGTRFDAYSAGTAPRSDLNPFAVQLLQQNGHDTSPLRAKTIAEFKTEDAPAFDFVFTVCDQAANEDCPAWSSQPISTHWGVPDPVAANGTEAQISLAFRQAYTVLQDRIKAFAALPIEALDPISLQQAVDQIGQHEWGPAA